MSEKLISDDNNCSVDDQGGHSDGGPRSTVD